MATHRVLGWARQARTRQEIEDAGRAAFAYGFKLEDCPFRPWEPGYVFWRRGWRVGQEAADEESRLKSGDE